MSHEDHQVTPYIHIKYRT